MKRHLFYLGFAALTAFATSSRADITVVVNHNTDDKATDAFKFQHVPSPAKDGLAGTFTVVDGSADGNGGGVEKLNDGKTPTEEDQPAENFFFNAGTPGGRLRLELKGVSAIREIDTYSWHPNTRAPQVYKVYGAAGDAAGFNAAPTAGTDPATCGWTLIASVDTRPKEGEPGGEYGVNIQDPNGLVGHYRYLLFDCKTTETDDEFGNTFYSEISVLGAGEAKTEATPAAPGKPGITAITDHNSNDDATSDFKFPHVPAPAKAGTAGTFAIVDGEIDPNSGGIEKLNDGKLPTEQDEPAENFFFTENAPGGRLRLDLNKVESIQQINTYSWHPNTRGPQVYKVYGATGDATGFNSAPKSGTDPASCGWTLLASVDTRPKDGSPGGQDGVSVRADSGTVGDYRYLLFDCKATEMTDDSGNTFYSEINVVEAPTTKP